jgi:hypothetical protein
VAAAASGFDVDAKAGTGELIGGAPGMFDAAKQSAIVSS